MLVSGCLTGKPKYLAIDLFADVEPIFDHLIHDRSNHTNQSAALCSDEETERSYDPESKLLRRMASW